MTKEVLEIEKTHPARRCFVTINDAYEDEVIVVKTGDGYVVGTVLDDWYVAPAHEVKRLLARLLKVEEEDVELRC